MLIKMQCPNCSGQTDMDTERDFMFCPYCGTKVANVAEKVEVCHSGTVVTKTDNGNLSNVIVTYNSVNTTVTAAVIIKPLRINSPMISGSNISYRLPKGRQTVVFRIGKRSYSRDIYINENNDAVKVYLTWNGRAHIDIDQPQYSEPSTAQMQTPVPVKDNKSGGPFSTAAIVLGILGIVFSIIMIFGWILGGTGLGLAIKAKIDSEKKSGAALTLSIIALGCSTLFSLIFLLSASS